MYLVNTITNDLSEIPKQMASELSNFLVTLNQNFTVLFALHQNSLGKSIFVDVVVPPEFEERKVWHQLRPLLNEPIEDKIWETSDQPWNFLVAAGVIPKRKIEEKSNATYFKCPKYDAVAIELKIRDFKQGEANYITKLKLLHEYYNSEILKNWAGAGLASHYMGMKVIVSVSKILEFHEKFYSALKTKTKANEVSQVFLDHVDGLTPLMSQYCNSIYRSEDTIATLGDKFKAFLNVCQDRMERNGKSHSFNSLRQETVQRLSRYGTILKELREVCDSNSATFKVIHKAAEVAKVMVTTVNDGLNYQKNLTLSLEIDKAIHSSGVVASSGVRYISDIHVREVTYVKNKVSKKEKWILLFNKFVVVVSKVDRSSKYTYECTIPFEGIRVIDWSDNDFIIKQKNGDQNISRHFNGDSFREKKAFVSKLEAILRFKEEGNQSVLFGEVIGDHSYYYKLMSTIDDQRKVRDVVCVVFEEGDVLVDHAYDNYNVLIAIQVLGKGKFKCFSRVRKECQATSRVGQEAVDVIDFDTLKVKFHSIIRNSGVLKSLLPDFYSEFDIEILNFNLMNMQVKFKPVETVLQRLHSRKRTGRDSIALSVCESTASTKSKGTFLQRTKSIVRSMRNGSISQFSVADSLRPPLCERPKGLKRDIKSAGKQLLKNLGIRKVTNEEENSKLFGKTLMFVMNYLCQMETDHVGEVKGSYTTLLDGIQ